MINSSNGVILSVMSEVGFHLGLLTSGCTYTQMVSASKGVRVKVGFASRCTNSKIVNFGKVVRVMVKVG